MFAIDAIRLLINSFRVVKRFFVTNAIHPKMTKYVHFVYKNLEFWMNSTNRSLLSKLKACKITRQNRLFWSNQRPILHALSTLIKSQNALTSIAIRTLNTFLLVSNVKFHSAKFVLKRTRQISVQKLVIFTRSNMIFTLVTWK